MVTVIQIVFMAICLGVLALAHKFAPPPVKLRNRGDGCLMLIFLAPAILIGIMYPMAVAKNLGEDVGIIGRLAQIVSTVALVLAVIRGWTVVLGAFLIGIVGVGVLWVLGVL